MAYLGDIQSHGLCGARTRGLLLGTIVADERREGKRQPQQDAGKKGWHKAWCLNSEACDKVGLYSLGLAASCSSVGGEVMSWHPFSFAQGAVWDTGHSGNEQGWHFVLCHWCTKPHVSRLFPAMVLAGWDTMG